METKKIEWLPSEQWKVLKIVKVEDPSKWNYFSGYIYYLRNLTTEYDEKKPDYLDELIEQAIRKVYHDSRIEYSKNILFKNQLEDVLKGFTGKKDDSLKFNITFIPEIPFDKMEEVKRKQLYTYTYPLNFSRISFNEAEKLKFLNTHFQSEIPFEMSSDFSERIYSVNFNAS